MTMGLHPSLTLPIKGRGLDENLCRAALCATLTLAAIAALIAARRLSGALSADLTAAPLAAALVLAAVTVFCGRELWRRYATPGRPAKAAVAWSGTAALLLLCLGCAPPRTQSYLWLACVPLLIADGVSRRAFLRPPKNASPAPPQASAMESAAREDAEADEQIVQELTRTRDAAGLESVRGTLRADFAVGRRYATLYAGFCPPLVATPDVEFETIDGPEATIKLVQALPQGVELELRLPEPVDEPCSVMVEIVAAPPSAPLSRRG